MHERVRDGRRCPPLGLPVGLSVLSKNGVPAQLEALQSFARAVSAVVIVAVGCVTGMALVASAASIAQAQTAPSTQTAPATKTGTVTGLPLPRFVSLKASRINLRKGPGTAYPTAWVFHQAGLPVEVVAEFEAWRRVRDADGTEGWVLRTLLSGRRTAQVAPWRAGEANANPDTASGGHKGIAVTKQRHKGSSAVVLVEPGVVADIDSCDGAWCYVTVSGFSGYLPQSELWGVYANEKVK